MPQDVSILDALASVLAEKLKYGPGERDMIMMQHKFKIVNADGSEVGLSIVFRGIFGSSN